jgi:DNA-directed RNA polymerase subunit RPC12/RpoP
MKFRCPHEKCGGSLELTLDQAGRTVRCPRCRLQVLVPAAAAPRPARAAGPPPEPVAEVEQALARALVFAYAVSLGLLAYGATAGVAAWLTGSLAVLIAAAAPPILLLPWGQPAALLAATIRHRHDVVRARSVRHEETFRAGAEQAWQREARDRVAGEEKRLLADAEARVLSTTRVRLEQAKLRVDRQVRGHYDDLAVREQARLDQKLREQEADWKQKQRDAVHAAVAAAEAEAAHRIEAERQANEAHVMAALDEKRRAAEARMAAAFDGKRRAALERLNQDVAARRDAAEKALAVWQEAERKRLSGEIEADLEEFRAGNWLELSLHGKCVHCLLRFTRDIYACGCGAHYCGECFDKYLPGRPGAPAGKPCNAQASDRHSETLDDFRKVPRPKPKKGPRKPKPGGNRVKLSGVAAATPPPPPPPPPRRRIRLTEP